jgi:hypothetical protein
MLGGSLNRVVHEEKGMKTLYTNTLIGRTLFINATNYKQGLTNCSKGFISGKSNPHNLQMQIISPKPGTFAVYLRDGSKSLKYFGVDSAHATFPDWLVALNMGLLMNKNLMELRRSIPIKNPP